jgi:hypothetical protein
MIRKIVGTKLTFALSSVLLLLFVAIAGAQQPGTRSYLDYLDSYYKTHDIEDLKQARSAVWSELDSTAALRFQSYYYNTEIEYLLTLEELRGNPHDSKKLAQLRTLMLQLYSRYLDAYYKIEPADVHNSNIPGNTAFLVKDIMMAAAFISNANSCIPLVKNILRRADRDSLYNRENSFIASVRDMIELEYPNLFGTANLVKAVWLNDKFIGMTEDDAEKERLRKLVNYHSSIAADTLSSDYGISIAYFLLAETYAYHENDMSWGYFQKCIDIFRENDIETTGFYGRNYNREIYIATAVAFIPSYSEYLYENERYSEIVNAAKYLADLDMLDRGKIENVTKEAIFWGEKSIRQLQGAGRYESADEIFKGLQGFYKILEQSEGQFGVTEQD